MERQDENEVDIKDQRVSSEKVKERERNVLTDQLIESEDILKSFVDYLYKTLDKNPKQKTDHTIEVDFESDIEMEHVSQPEPSEQEISDLLKNLKI